MYWRPDAPGYVATPVRPPPPLLPGPSRVVAFETLYLNVAAEVQTPDGVMVRVFDPDVEGTYDHEVFVPSRTTGDPRSLPVNVIDGAAPDVVQLTVVALPTDAGVILTDAIPAEAATGTTVDVVV